MRDWLIAALVLLLVAAAGTVAQAQCLVGAIRAPVPQPNRYLGSTVSAAEDLLAAAESSSVAFDNDAVIFLFRHVSGDWVHEHTLAGFGRGHLVGSPTATSSRSVHYWELATYDVLDWVKWEVRTTSGWQEVYAVLFSELLRDLAVSDLTLVEASYFGRITVRECDPETGSLVSTDLVSETPGSIFDGRVAVGDGRIIVYEDPILTVFQRTGTGWSTQYQSDQHPGAAFVASTPDGAFVVLNNTAYSVVGSGLEPGFTFPGPPSFDGANNAWVDLTYFQFDGATWEEVGTLTPDVAPPGVSLTGPRDPAIGRRMFVGAPFYDDPDDSGAVFEFSLACGPAAGQGEFVRGDCNGIGGIEIADAISVLNYLFNGSMPVCLDACDSDDSSSINLADAVRILVLIFEAGPAPAAPFPACGYDVSPDDVGCPGSAACP